MSLRIVFVLSPYQNAFFTEIADALTEALVAAEIDTLTTTEPGDHEVADDDVFVLLPPHEYVALEGAGFVEDETVAARTIGISAEQPQESFFAHNAAIGARLGFLLDFSPLAVTAYRRQGVDARQLRFGYVPSWDRVRDRGGRRRIDTPVLYLGSKAERRMQMLASATTELAHHGARLVISDNSEPNRTSDAAFYVGERKRDLLEGTGLLVNIHQSDEQYWEWLRFIEATHCGTPMLTERSMASEPFVDGEDFASFEGADFARRLDELMDDSDQRKLLAESAYRRLLEHPLSESIVTLIDAATSLRANVAPKRLPARTRAEPIGRERTDIRTHATWVAPTGPWSKLRRRIAGKWVVVAPTGTLLRASVDELIGAGDRPFINVMANGHAADGSPMLEGIWMWQPWRLLHAQHLGRVMIVETDVERAARSWLPDADFDDHPHLRIQLFAAVHGLTGGHVASPMASLSVPVDIDQRVPERLSARCRQLLEATS